MKRAVVTVLLAAEFLVAAPLFAVTAGNVATAACTTAKETTAGTCPTDPFAPKSGSCVKLALPIFKGGSAGAGDSVCNNTEGGAIVQYLKQFLLLAGTAVGLVIVTMIIVSGIQYITAFGDPAGIKTAKGRLVNAVTALLLFLLMYAILGFIVPGGIL